MKNFFERSDPQKGDWNGSRVSVVSVDSSAMMILQLHR
jgi:hypothetical protein